MTPVPTGDTNVEVRLERIQAAIDVGNTQTKGQLEILMLRLSHSDRLADEREQRAAVELKERDTRLDKLELKTAAQDRKLWFLAGSASALGVAANVGVQLLLHR